MHDTGNAASDKSTHLLVGRDGFAALRANASRGEGLILAERILHDARLLLDEPPQERVVLSFRLLEASRNILYRINTLATAFHLTGDRVYATRAATEMAKACSFEDWNPRHFLDTAEMTLAIAIGSDWLRDELLPEELAGFRRAIIEKGLTPSLRAPHDHWVTLTNNWNPVCHCGMVAGALAVRHLEPALCETVVRRAVEHLPASMLPSYEPNGAYPEGPMYWGYGTEFNALLLALLRGAYGHDFALSEQKGFRRTGDYMLAAAAPSGLPFNYADCECFLRASFGMVWLAHAMRRPDWFFRFEQPLLRRECEPRPASVAEGGNRLYPLCLTFLSFDATEERAENSPLHFYSGDAALVPVAMHRTDPTPAAGYLGVKGGSPSAPHGHMDGGSFVYEANGVRWAIELGKEDYTRIEDAGWELWPQRQNSPRWELLRIGPESHNILRIDDARQNVSGVARITASDAFSSTLDLTELYRLLAAAVTRHLRLGADQSLTVIDTLTGLQPGIKVAWQMCTAAEIVDCNGEAVTLRQDGKALTIRMNRPGRWRALAAEDCRMGMESPNPGVSILIFQCQAPPDGRLELVAELRPS